MINGLHIYYSKKERSHSKGLAPISTNKNINLLMVLKLFRQIKEKDVKKLDLDYEFCNKFNIY